METGSFTSWTSVRSDNIKRAASAGSRRLPSRQTFWVLLAVILACIFLSFATNSFATSNNLFNVTRNFTFVAIIALGMTRGDHHRGHRPLGRLGAVPVQHGSRGGDACRLQYRGRHRRLARLRRC